MGRVYFNKNAETILLQLRPQESRENAMNHPRLSNAQRLQRLDIPRGKLRVVLDTDTYNEIDDQFAVVHALRSPERLQLEALYAAPFHNDRSAGPGDGMEKSHDEILRLLERLSTSADGLVHRGSASFLTGALTPVESDAARDLVQRALASDDAPLYVIAIAAVTNIASAILMEPRIIESMVVVWLGGHALHWPHTREFNLKQDVHATRILLDSGVPLILLPCLGVTSHLLTSSAEIDRYVKGQGAIGDYLAQVFHEHQAKGDRLTKEIWDIAATACLINDAWVPTELVTSPVLTDQLTWSVDRTRHLIKVASFINRDAVFRDLFEKLRG
jgi:purine nucleosidase